MNLQTLLTKVLVFLNGVIVPFLLALAGLIFIWNAARYFIIGGANEAEREKARSLAVWGIFAFVIIVSLWGVVNAVAFGLGITRTDPVAPDYIQSRQHSDDDEGPRSPGTGE